MPSKRKNAGTLVISRKWALRSAGVLLLTLAGLLFFFSSLSFRMCGVLFAIGLGCIIWAEFTED